MNNQIFKLGALAKKLNAKLIGDGEIHIKNASSLDAKSKHTIAYISDKKHLIQLKKTKVAAVILSENFLPFYKGNALVVKNPHVTFARFSKLYYDANQIKCAIHPTAIIDDTALIGTHVSIGAYSVIGANCIIRANCIIGTNCVIGSNVSFGKHNHLGNLITIHSKTKIGDFNVIASGSVIGSEGFGNARDEYHRWHSIYHFGGVILKNDINIGANVTIDKGVLGDTHIENGVRIDNLVHIAHNVYIGAHTAIAAGAKIAGSVYIGKYCLIAGMVGVIDHRRIVDNVTIYASTIVYKDITKAGEYTGIMPMMTHKKWHRTRIWIKKLDKMAKFLKIKKAYLQN